MSDKESNIDRPSSSRKHSRNYRTRSTNDRYHGNPLLKDFIIVGEYPKPTDDSPRSHRGLPAVKATSESTCAEVVKSREHIDREDLDEYDFVTTLDKAKQLRGAENGEAQFPSCDNGKPLTKKTWWQWLTWR